MQQNKSKRNVSSNLKKLKKIKKKTLKIMKTLNCLLQREDDSWEAIWPLQEAAPHDCTDDHRLEKHTLFDQKQIFIKII